MRNEQREQREHSDPTEQLRHDVLRSLGATAAEADELMAYGRSAFVYADMPDPSGQPLADEPFVSAWEEYVAEAASVGAVESLRRRVVQLRFPIADGISQSEAYRAASRRGVVPADAAPGDGLRLARPDALRVMLHQTAAGRVPVIVAGTREDFASLVQALTRRNEPEPIPASMGACIVAGYNNWDRVARLRVAWEAVHPEDCSDAAWLTEFQQIVPKRHLYQDRFIVLSRGPYSAVPAAALGLSDEAWDEMSLTIRLEHECAHYFTRRVFGSMRNSLLDEFIADYVGIVAAAGRYCADWFLHFMGLEGSSRYRAGGRLENYRGTPALSDGAFAILGRLVRRAAESLESFDRARGEHPRTIAERALRIGALARLSLEELACEESHTILARAVLHAGGAGRRAAGAATEGDARVDTHP